MREFKYEVTLCFDDGDNITPNEAKSIISAYITDAKETNGILATRIKTLNTQYE